VRTNAPELRRELHANRIAKIADGEVDRAVRGANGEARQVEKRNHNLLNRALSRR